MKLQLFFLGVGVLGVCWTAHELCYRDKFRGMNGFCLALNLSMVEDVVKKLIT